MGVSNDVFVESTFQGRLFKCSEYYQAEIFLFTEMLGAHGVSMLDTPGYCVVVPAENTGDERVRVWVKFLGSWTPLRIEVRERGVLVISDR